MNAWIRLADSSMPWRRERSSRIDWLGALKDAQANDRFQAALWNQIDSPAQDALQVRLEPAEMNEPDAQAGLKLNEKVDIAVVPESGLEGGAEKEELAHAVAPANVGDLLLLT
jgi:hypothetical protein